MHMLRCIDFLISLSKLFQRNIVIKRNPSLGMLTTYTGFSITLTFMFKHEQMAR